MGNSNMLDQESRNLNNTAKKVITPEEHKNILWNWNIHGKPKEKHLLST